MENKIVMLPVDKLCPHPDNPRKQLGDVTELADSIKKSGILQNLTVVPFVSKVNPNFNGTGMYTVVIGHRRLAAAKLAGLTEVPCAISDMDYKEQLSTMLVENMHRSDLSIYEQAKGFQMMLDLGETQASIAEKTGFSEATVCRRIKLASLDEELFKASANRNVTFDEYMKLDKIADEAVKKNLLRVIGTSEFERQYKNALDNQKTKMRRQKIKDVLNEFATKIDEAGPEYTVYKSFSDYISAEDIKIPENEGETEYFWSMTSWGYFYIYTKKTQEQLDSAEAEQRIRDNAVKERQERIKMLDELTKDAYESRCEFVKNLSKTIIKKNINIIIAHWIRKIALCSEYVEETDVIELFDLDVFENKHGQDDIDFNDVLMTVALSPEVALWKTLWLHYEDSTSHKYYLSWSGMHEQNYQLDEIYDLLCRLGYVMSKPEKELQDGTHPLFEKEK